MCTYTRAALLDIKSVKYIKSVKHHLELENLRSSDLKYMLLIILLFVQQNKQNKTLKGNPSVSPRFLIF